MYDRKDKMATSTGCDDECLISKGLFRILSDVVGPECIVKLRRQGLDILDTLTNCTCFFDQLFVSSGSRAEGFDFDTSDIDIMYVEKRAAVLSRSTFLKLSYNKTPSILAMETDNTSPGFAFVKCVRCDKTNTELHNSLVFRGNDIYVSGKHFRETFMSRRISTCHGPCQTFTLFDLEVDEAYTLNCPILPKQAMPFIRRSLEQGWPSHDVLTNICRDGCLLVPINSKHQQYSDMIDLEWRISFSLAEKQLVYSLNHPQFLCYGLSKLFLNEVIKKNLDGTDLLCSYFMKTALFWEISDNSFDWTPINILPKFWNTFRRMIKWVSIGYCPNFFIPEHNMFYSKIYGETQRALLVTLCDIYTEGYNSLLRCSSIKPSLSPLVLLPQLSYFLSCNEKDYVPISKIEYEKLHAICMFDVMVNAKSKDAVLKALKNTLMLRPESTEMLYAVTLKIGRILQCHAECIISPPDAVPGAYNQNRRKYKDMTTSYRILSRTNTFFCMSYFILIKLMYKAGSYERTIDMIHYCKHKLKSIPYMCKLSLNDDMVLTLLKQGISYDTLIKSFVVSELKLDAWSTIEELRLESMAVYETMGGMFLDVHPLVFLDFLLLLSYTRLGENHKRIDVLHELKSIVYDDHIKFSDTVIPWEILGICQQLCGDYDGALQSFMHALVDKDNVFKSATLERIKSVEYHKSSRYE